MATPTFAFRMPNELKEAARAVSKVSFSEPAIKEGYVNHVAFGSINDALIYLTRTGLKQTLTYIDKRLAEVSAEQDLWSEFVTFFIQNPVAHFAEAHNFAEGSHARKYFDILAEQDRDNLARHERLPKERQEEVGDFESDYQPVERADATSELQFAQRQLMDLTAAKGAIQRALAGPR